jgi:hypothetical protein
VTDRDEQRPFVDPLHDLRVVLAHDDLEVGLRLVQVTHGREVPALVDDTILALGDAREAREDDRLGNRDVLLHHRRPCRRADDPADLVADLHRRPPPTLRPCTDTALGPHTRELVEPVRRLSGHRPERVAREVGRILEDRKLGAVVEELAHGPSVID